MTAARAFALIGLTLAISGAVGTIVVRLVAPAPFLPVAFGFNGATMVGFVIEGLIWTSIGALLVIRRPGNAVGWFMVVVGAGYALSQLSVSLAFAFADQGTARGHSLAQIAGWVTVMLQLVGIFQIGIGFVFPDGRIRIRRSAPYLRLYWVFATVFVVISATQPGALQLFPSLENPFGFGPDLRGDRPLAPVLALVTVIVFGALGTSMVARYRSAGRVERQQLKWFVMALGVSAIGLGIATSEAIFVDRPANAIGLTVYVFAGAVVPVAIGIAILRHHLYDIDRIISRSIAYAVMTATLGATFAGSALVLGTVLGSQGPGETVQVAGATLLVVAIFGTVRRRAQAIVDRRFDRAHYDATRTIDALTTRLRDDMDLADLEADVLGVVGETFHPDGAAVWLRPPRRSRSDHLVTIPGHRLATIAPR